MCDVLVTAHKLQLCKKRSVTPCQRHLGVTPPGIEPVWLLLLHNTLVTQHIYTQAVGLLTCLELFEAETGRDTLCRCRAQSGVTLWMCHQGCDVTVEMLIPDRLSHLSYSKGPITRLVCLSCLSTSQQPNTPYGVKQSVIWPMLWLSTSDSQCTA